MTAYAQASPPRGTRHAIYARAGSPAFTDVTATVVTRAAETNRSGRHLLRTRLRWAGFGSLAPGVWISTHRDRVADAEQVLREAEVFDDCQVFLSEHLTGGDPATMVRHVWNLDEAEREYESFLAEFAQPPSGDPLVRVTRLVHEWRRVILLDPALPGKLLPDGWIGTEAARLFQRRHATWIPAATREWTRISEEAR